MKKLNIEHITLGVCYYPEHWDKSLWRDDLRKMKEYGIETVRIAEFAWNKFEPHEGVFSFDFFDEFMKMTIEENINVIFCTPSATPPAWMSEKYPEILNADIDGNLINHGLRRHCNLNSEKYRFFVSRITEKIAEHYSKYPNIKAWQLDNEINCECDFYYSKSDHRAFREYLKNKFGSLDNLNEAIGAAFWNQTYTSWEEVHLPRRTNADRMGNPHIGLLEKRFISDTVISFFKLQSDIIRRYSDAPVTTNGVFRHIDYHRLVEEVLDFITYQFTPTVTENAADDKLIWLDTDENIATIDRGGNVMGYAEGTVTVYAIARDSLSDDEAQTLEDKQFTKENDCFQDKIKESQIAKVVTAAIKAEITKAADISKIEQNDYCSKSICAYKKHTVSDVLYKLYLIFHGKTALISQSGFNTKWTLAGVASPASLRAKPLSYLRRVVATKFTTSKPFLAYSYYSIIISVCKV